MTANDLFNDLHFQKDALRDHIFDIIEQAKAENNTEVIYRLGKVLEANPNAKTFDLTIVKYASGGLNAPRHSGDYKIALDDCGRLRPGFKFDKGRIVAVAPKVKKTVTKKVVVKPIAKEKKAVVKKPIVKKDVIPLVEKVKKASKSVFMTKDADLKKYDFIYEVGYKSKLYIKSYFDLPLSRNVKLNISVSQDKTYNEYVANDNGLNELKKLFPNNSYGDKYRLTSKDLNKPTPPTNRGNEKKKTENKPVTKKNSTSTNFVNVPLSDIFTDEKRFQNRSKLDDRIVNNIVKNYNATQFNPIVLWRDKKQNKLFVLAGHHRLEAVKQLKHKTVVAFIDNRTEAEAIHFAKFQSNADRTLETPADRAKIYREMRVNGKSKTEINELAKETEPRANFVIALSYLEPKGIVLTALNALEKSDTQNLKTIETIAEWIGAAKSTHDLTAAHEKEMFDFLQDKEASKRITTKAEFTQKITAITSGFDFDNKEPLYLKRFKYTTEGEKLYDVEYKELQKKLNVAIDNKASLKDRISNPKNPDFIKPTDSNYNSILKALDTAMNKYSAEIVMLQKKIVDLSRRKGSYTNAGSNQIGMFGYVQTEILKTSNLFLDCLPDQITSKLKTVFDNFKNVKILNKETNKLVHINRVAKGKVLFGGSAIDTKVATAIYYLPHLITFGKLVNENEPKPHHIQKYKATKILNFQSKLNIEGKTEYFIITVIDRKLDGLHYYIEAANIKKSVRLHGSKLQNVKSTLSNGIKSNITKSIPNYQINAKNKIINCSCGWKWNLKDGGNDPYICHKCGNDTKKRASLKSPATANSNSLAARMANKSTQTANYYIIPDADIKAFLGDVEIKNKESVAITITGGQGSMKTRLCFQLMNCFAQKYKVGHASIEEHPDSNLYYDKVKQYIKGETALNNISAPEISNIADVHKLVRENDVIIIDSFSKLQELERGVELDKDFRKAYNGKLFIIIYQQTTDGKMRGGAKSQFDGDIIGFVKKEDNYQNNYAYWDKNRYHSGNLEDLKFNIFNGKLNNNQLIQTVAKEQFSFSAV